MPESDNQNTFSEVIEAIDAQESDPSRHLSIQIDRSLREATLATQHSNQSASVTITVKVRAGPERRVDFSATVAAKLPRPPVPGVTLYADQDGSVHKQDPAQKRFDFHHRSDTEN